MKFVKENKEMLILLLILIVGENLHLFFSGLEMEKSYYFIQQMGVITLIPSIYIYYHQKTDASKAIGLGIIIWNLKEFADEVVYSVYGYHSVFDPISTNRTTEMKIVFIIFVVLLSLRPWKSLGHFLLHWLPITWQLHGRILLNGLLSLLKKALSRIIKK